MAPISDVPETACDPISVPIQMKYNARTTKTPTPPATLRHSPLRRGCSLEGEVSRDSPDSSLEGELSPDSSLEGDVSDSLDVSRFCFCRVSVIEARLAHDGATKTRWCLSRR